MIYVNYHLTFYATIFISWSFSTFVLTIISAGSLAVDQACFWRKTDECSTMAASSDPLESSNALMVLFFTMHMFGWIGSLTIVLTVVLSSKVQRHIIWTNLCIAWIIACFSYSFLLLTGQLYNPIPNSGVCLVQASAVYAVPSLAAGATLSLAIHLWLQFRSPVPTNESEFKRHAIRSIILVVAPYLVPIGLFVAAFVYGLQRPEKVVLADSMMYCGLKNSVPGKISAIFVGVTMVPTILFEGLVIYNLYHQWYEYSKSSRNAFSTVIRISAFTFFGVFAIGISLTYLSSKSYGRLPNVLMALPPVSFVIIFATQADLMSVWMFWRRIDIPKPGPEKPVEIRIDSRYSRYEDVAKYSYNSRI